jgi:hypothetical protein
VYLKLLGLLEPARTAPPGSADTNGDVSRELHPQFTSAPCTQRLVNSMLNRYAHGAQTPSGGDAMKRAGWKLNAKTCQRRMTVSLMLLLATAIFLAGCGTGTQSLPPSNPTDGGGGTVVPPVNNTLVMVTLDEFSDVPDNVVSFYLTVDSVELHSAKDTVGLLSAPRTLEFSRKQREPLVLGQVPQGNYVGITVNVSKPVISYIDENGSLHENVAAALTASSATNPSEFGFVATPGGANLNLGFDTTFGNQGVSVTPRLNLTTGVRATRNVVGRSLGASGNSVTIDVDAFRDTLDPGSIEGAFSMITRSSTEFRGATGISGLGLGKTIKVDATVNSSGDYVATVVEVESDDPNAVVADGLALTATPGEVQILVRNNHGPNTTDQPRGGKLIPVDVSKSTFHVDADRVDLTGLDFAPDFGAQAIARGQNLRVASTTYSATQIVADSIKLESQSVDGVAGIVANGTTADQFTFPLKLAVGSAMAQITGQGLISVTVQPSTEKRLYFGEENCLACITDGVVRVRGLLFYSGGQYHLVAESVTAL